MHSLMRRRVRRKVAARSKGRVDCPDLYENLSLDDNGLVDWTRLPDDTMIRLFSSLNYRDRANLSSTCQVWHSLGKSPFLWKVLDLRHHKFNPEAANSLASRCGNLQKLRVRDSESVGAIINLKAKTLREISFDSCRKMYDASLSVLVARHEDLESLCFEVCERITCDAINAIAICCPKLQKLWLSGLHEVNADTINCLAKHCSNLTNIGFIDCRNVNEGALGNFTSVRFLSLAGTTDLKWDVVLKDWVKLKHLICLDVSRTDIPAHTISGLFSCLFTLKVVCALNCPLTEVNGATLIYNNRGKVLLAVFTDILKEIDTLLVDKSKNDMDIFLDWRKSKFNDKNLDDILNWIEWIMSHSLLRVSEMNPIGLNNFWLKQGTNLLHKFLESDHEEVQERAANALATFVVIDDANGGIDITRTEAVMKEGGIRRLLNLACSWQEGLQYEAVKAISNLSVSGNVAKAVVEEGGIDIIINLLRFPNRLVVEEAAGALWNLSIGDEHKGTIVEDGGVRALVDLISKCSNSKGREAVMERAAGALANLAADEKCSIEIGSVGGVHILVKLAQNCKVEGVQEQASRALANIAAHGDCSSNQVSVGHEPGALEVLVQLVGSHHNGVRQEAAGALWNLAFDDRNRAAIAAAGGVEALVALAQSCSNASHSLQERAAGALWGLSVSQANSIAIGQEGGIPPLIRLARSAAEDVHETAAGALWNLSFYPGNAHCVVEEGGVIALVHICSSSISKIARFMSALALAYIFDKGIDEIAPVGTSAESVEKAHILQIAQILSLETIENFLMTFYDAEPFAARAATAALNPAAITQLTESLGIEEARHLRCSGSEVGRFVAMLRNSSPILKSCAAFALLQFTLPGGRHASHHVNLLQNAGAPRVLRAVAAATVGPVKAKLFARIVLRNLEHVENLS